jgi:hypothetical protein
LRVRSDGSKPRKGGYGSRRGSTCRGSPQQFSARDSVGINLIFHHGEYYREIAGSVYGFIWREIAYDFAGGALD